MVSPRTWDICPVQHPFTVLTGALSLSSAFIRAHGCFIPFLRNVAHGLLGYWSHASRDVVCTSVRSLCLHAHSWSHVSPRRSYLHITPEFVLPRTLLEPRLHGARMIVSVHHFRSLCLHTLLEQRLSTELISAHQSGACSSWTCQNPPHSHQDARPWTQEHCECTRATL